jgi:hypothetical protein
MSASKYKYTTFRFVPFTGPVFAIWAFFEPESFGRWFGTIIRAFRASTGL